MSMMQHLFRMTLVPACVAVALVSLSGTLATDVPRKAYSGTVSAIDTSAPSLTVQGANAASRMFQVTSTTTIVTAGNPNAKLSNLKVGDRVDVSYTEEDKKLVAHRIECTSSSDVP
jgi:Cu/Ag efflux protein CusF